MTSEQCLGRNHMLAVLRANFITPAPSTPAAAACLTGAGAAEKASVQKMYSPVAWLRSVMVAMAAPSARPSSATRHGRSELPGTSRWSGPAHASLLPHDGMSSRAPALHDTSKAGCLRAVRLTQALRAPVHANQPVLACRRRHLPVTSFMQRVLLALQGPRSWANTAKRGIALPS